MTWAFLTPNGSQIKARLMLQIYRLINDRRITQAEAGEILGIEQPHVSGLMRGQSGNLSVERLMDFLTALGQDVEIIVRQGTWQRLSRLGLNLICHALALAF